METKAQNIAPSINKATNQTSIVIIIFYLVMGMYL